MAVLVHPNLDNELANGVALTKNVYFSSFEGYYITEFETIYIRRSIAGCGRLLTAGRQMLLYASAPPLASIALPVM